MRIKVQENFFERKMKLPPLGQRIIKTSIAVFFCLFIYHLRGYQGMISESCVAAILCMQPFKENSVEESLNRVIGTLIGAAWGLLFLAILDAVPALGYYMMVVYVLMGAGVVITLYSTVILKQTNASALAAIVFVSIMLAYPDVDSPLTGTIERVVDLMIGIIVAGAVNVFSMPRVKHPEYVFYVRTQDLVPDRYAHVSPKILVLLNRLYNDGARICLTTRWAPAFLLSQMGTMNMSLPVIVMDGAAMYDIENKQYMNVAALSRENLEFLEYVLQTQEHGYCIYAVQESNMFVYRRGEMNEMEEEDFKLMKRSPYRNYVNGDLAEEDQVVFVRLIDSNERIDELERILRKQIPVDRIRMVKRLQPKMDGCSGLYFYNPAATIENRKKELIAYLKEHGEECIVPVDLVLQDSVYTERGAIHLLNKLHNIYEPIDFK